MVLGSNPAPRRCVAREHVAHKQIGRRNERADRHKKPCRDGDDKREGDQEGGRRDQQEHEEQTRAEDEDDRASVDRWSADQRCHFVEAFARGWASVCEWSGGGAHDWCSGAFAVRCARPSTWAITNESTEIPSVSGDFMADMCNSLWFVAMVGRPRA